MKNLKRILCLALSVVMLLGMMMLGTSAANFTDAESIVNTEAVEITAGIGLFSGTPDGRFDPQGTVTRAQMATIITKMVYGSDFNADPFKGVETFTDTAAFESGWAEGYINACAQLGIVAGYGDGTYRPGQQVTTAEAVTMIINALKVDAGEGTWPLTVMAKAEQMKLFDGLANRPATNVALSRDELAVISLQGLRYSPSGASGYTVPGVKQVFNNYSDALRAAISVGLTASQISEVVGEDTLGHKTFAMKSVSGIIEGNQATGEEHTVLAGDLNQYDTDTGLDEIGHYVTIYYKELEKTDYVQVYCVIDESESIAVPEDITTSANYRAAFGKSTRLADDIMVFDNEYVLTEASTVIGYVAGSAAPAGTYVVYEGEVISYIDAPIVTAAYVVDIDQNVNTGKIWLSGLGKALNNAENNDDVAEYVGIAIKDYVTYTVANGKYVLKPVDPVNGTITRTSRKDGRDVITMNGKDYVAFNGVNNSELNTNVNTIDYGAKYALYVTEDGEYIGFDTTEATVSMDDIAYILGSYIVKEQDEYGAEVTRTYAQGVDTTGKEVNYLLAVAYPDKTVGTAGAMVEGFYSYKASTSRDERKEGIYKLTKIGSEYDKENNPLFLGANRWISTSSTTIKFGGGTVYGTMHLCTDACTATKHVASNPTEVCYYHSGTKFLLIDGTLGQQLSTKMIPQSSMNYSTSSSKGDKELGFNMLFSRGEGGSTQIDLVIMKKDPDSLNVATSGTVYVSAQNLKPASQDARGYAYEVYDAASGSITTITMSNPNAFTSGGFYSYTLDDEGLATNLKKVTSGNYWGDLLFVSLYNGTRPTMAKLAGGVGGTPNGYDASNVVVIDVRSEEEMEASGVDAITSLARISSLSNSSNKFVTLDAAGKSSSTVSVIYVTGVYTAPRSPETVFLYAPVTANNSVVTVRDDKGNDKKIFVSTAAPGLSGYVDYALVNGKAVVSESTATINDAHINNSALSGNTLTVEGKSYDLSGASITDTTGNGITSVAKLAQAMSTDGVRYLVCNMLPNTEGTALIELVVTGADIADTTSAVDHTTKASDIFYSVGPLNNGYGAGEGDVWLVYDAIAGRVIEPRKVHISWATTNNSAVDINHFYRWTTSNEGTMYANSDRVFSGYYSYKYGYHNLVNSIDLNGGVINTSDAPGHESHAAYNVSTGAASGLNNCAGSFLAPSTLTFTDAEQVYVVDTRSSAIEGMGKISTLAELADRVEAGEEIMIDYYCHFKDQTYTASDARPSSLPVNCIFIIDTI